jgi:hypothetical protein
MAPCKKTTYDVVTRKACGTSCPLKVVTVTLLLASPTRYDEWWPLPTKTAPHNIMHGVIVPVSECVPVLPGCPSAPARHLPPQDQPQGPEQHSMAQHRSAHQFCCHQPLSLLCVAICCTQPLGSHRYRAQHSALFLTKHRLPQMLALASCKGAPAYLC